MSKDNQQRYERWLRWKTNYEATKNMSPEERQAYEQKQWSDGFMDIFANATDEALREFLTNVLVKRVTRGIETPLTQRLAEALYPEEDESE